MSIRGIDPGSFSNVCLTPEAQIAVMVLQNEDQQQEINQQEMATARRDFIAHSSQEVAAMHAEADHIALGAWTEAGITLAGTAIQGAAIYGEAKYSLTNKAASETWANVRACAVSTSGGLASAVSKGLGDSPAADDRAEAKEFSTAAKQDEWTLEDRKNAIHESQASQRQATDWLSKLVEKDAATTTAVLSSLA